MTSPTSLTDLYLWAVTRHLPGDFGSDVAAELRATITDAIDDRVAAGDDVDSAERSAIEELGDPEVLARRYGGRPPYLVGPGLYPQWVRLLRTLLEIVVPLVLAGSLLISAGENDGVGEMVLEAFLVVIGVGVHLAFWVTLSFAVIERARPETQRDRPLHRWTADDLTTAVPARRVGAGETILSTLLAVAMAALVGWQFLGVGSNGIQVLNPDLDVVWEVALVALFLVDALVAVLVWRSGRWTAALAAVNVATNAGAAVLLLWLLARGALLADLPRVGDKFGWSTDWSVPTALIAAVVVIIAAWDAVGAVIRARLAAR